MSARCRAATEGLTDGPRESSDGRAERRRTSTGVRRWVPWQGRAGRVDVALMGAILGVVGLGLTIRPLTPFLLAHHPVLLGFLTGDLVAIGAGAAFARIGEAPLWLVVLAGAVGMVKFDWLAWWAGRQWGAGIVRMFTTSERVQRAAADAEQRPWIMRLAVVLAVLPGVPTAVVYAAAGWARMRLATFLVLDLVGALLMTALVAGLGYRLGQRAVDVVLVIDSYASTASLAIIAGAVVIPVLRRRLRRRGRGGGASGAPGAPSPGAGPPAARAPRRAGPAPRRARRRPRAGARRTTTPPRVPSP